MKLPKLVLIIGTILILTYIISPVIAPREFLPFQGKILNGTTLVTSGQINISIFQGVGTTGTAIFTENFTSGNLTNGFTNIILGNSSELSTIYGENYTFVSLINGVRFENVFQSKFGNITSRWIQDNNITADDIQDGTIGANDIGVGVINDTHILNGTIRPDDFNISASPTNGQFLTYNSTYNILTWVANPDTNSGGNVTGGGSVFYIPRWANATHLVSGIITDNGTYVGVNTTAPNATFIVDGNASITQNFTVDSTTFFVDSSTNRIGIGTRNPTESIYTTGAISWTNGQSGLATVSADVSNGPWIAGHTNGDGTSALNNAAGRVSVGGGGVILATSPATAVGNARTFTERLLVEIDGDTGIGDIGPLDAFVDILNSGSSDSFRIDDSTDNEATPFIINNQGDVGIGTAAPLTKLHLAEGNLTINGRLNVTSVSHLANISIGQGTNITNQTSTNVTLDFGATAAATCDEINATINGARITDTIMVGAPPSAFTDAGDKNSYYHAYVYLANTVTVRRCNLNAASALTNIPLDGFRLSVWSHY